MLREKGEIACTSSFFFSHNVFKRASFQTRQKVSLCRNGLSKADSVDQTADCMICAV